MTRQNQHDLLEAVASTLAAARDLDGIRIGDSPIDSPLLVDRVDFTEGSKQAWLRLNNGEAWLLRVHKLGDFLATESEIGIPEVRRSYNRYLAILSQWHVTERTLSAGGMSGEDINTYLQAWHDDILSDDERADYDCWISGGYASNQEWDIVNGMG